MTINAKLRIAVVAPLLMALVTGLALGLAQQAIRAARHRDQVVERVISGMNELNSLAAVYILYHEERPRQQFLDEHGNAARLLAAVHFPNAKQQQLLEILRENTHTLKDTFLRIVATHERLAAAPDPVGLRRDEDRLGGQLLVRSRQAVADSLRLKTLIDAEIATTQHRVNILVFLIILVVILPLTLVLKGMMARISSQLATLHQGTEAVGSGMLTHRIGLAGTDELAGLARAFDQMTGRLQAVTVSKNDLEREVEERRRAQQALGESEQRIQQALRVSHSFTFEWDPATDRILRSASCETILGLTGDDACHDTGRHFFQRIHPDDRARFVQMLQELTPAGGTYMTEYRVERGNGVMVVLEEIGQASFTADGKLARLVGVTTDITARQQAEANLRQLNAELEERVSRQTAALNQLNSELEERISTRTAELERANETLRGSRLAALNLMKDAIEARQQAEQAEAEIRRHAEKLRAANTELAQFNRVAVDRELRMVELKKQVNELCLKAGLPARYKMEFEKEKEKESQ